MLKLDQEFHKAHSELANTIGGLNTALRTTSQATGDVAASEGHCIEYPTLCDKTKSIVKACKLVVQCHDDWQSDVQTTPITLVQACEQLNCLLKRMRTPIEGQEE